MQASQSAVASATLSTFNLPFVIRGLLSNSLSSAEAHSQALSLCQEARSILTMVFDATENPQVLSSYKDIQSSIATAAALIETAELVVSVTEENANE